MLGDKGKAVRVHYRTSRGKLKKVIIASHHPNALAESINQARAALTPAGDTSQAQVIGQTSTDDRHQALDTEVIETVPAAQNADKA